jgi:2-polyprenyl-3-methyl-5-hydroxy-6-metoxy-1,4-benzoquinol methylase
LRANVNPWETVIEEKGRVFLKPHENMEKVVTILKQLSAKTILDLGCGTGRHTVFLAAQGFDVYGLDSSSKGLDLTEAWLKESNLKAHLTNHDMSNALPYQDNFFDAVISVQVIHHGTLASIRSLIEEITRVLKTHGLLFVTVPKLKNQAGHFEQIEPNTFVPLDGREKGLPHYYFTSKSLRTEFANYGITSIDLDQAMHFCLTGFKLPANRAI